MKHSLSPIHQQGYIYMISDVLSVDATVFMRFLFEVASMLENDEDDELFHTLLVYTFDLFERVNNVMGNNLLKMKDEFLINKLLMLLLHISGMHLHDDWPQCGMLPKIAYMCNIKPIDIACDEITVLQLLNYQFNIMPSKQYNEYKTYVNNIKTDVNLWSQLVQHQ